MGEDEVAGARLLWVRVRLVGGGDYELRLPEGSPTLEAILAEAAGQGGGSVALPLPDGRTTVHLASDRILAVETRTPSVGEERLPPAVSRSAEDLKKPDIWFFGSDPVAARPAFERSRRAAQELTAPFHKRTRQRREELRELCEGMGRRRFVVSTLNAGFEPMLRNWAASCDHHGIDARSQTLLFPTDAQADRLGRELGFTTFFDGVSFEKIPAEAARGYGDGIFGRCVVAKIAMLQDMLQLGYDCLLQDADLVWFEDPVPDLDARAEQEGLDFLFMRDMNPRFQPLYYNSGFLYARSNEFSRFAWEKVFDSYAHVLHFRSDQTVVNTVVSCLRERGLRTARLPEAYVDGQILAQAEIGKRSLPERRIVAHVNWTGDLAAKISRLKKAGMWYLAEEAAPSRSGAQAT